MAHSSGLREIFPEILISESLIIPEHLIAAEFENKQPPSDMLIYAILRICLGLELVDIYNEVNRRDPSFGYDRLRVLGPRLANYFEETTGIKLNYTAYIIWLSFVLFDLLKVALPDKWCITDYLPQSKIVVTECMASSLEKLLKHTTYNEVYNIINVPNSHSQYLNRVTNRVRQLTEFNDCYNTMLRMKEVQIKNYFVLVLLRQGILDYKVERKVKR